MRRPTTKQRSSRRLSRFTSSREAVSEFERHQPRNPPRQQGTSVLESCSISPPSAERFALVTRNSDVSPALAARPLLTLRVTGEATPRDECVGRKAESRTHSAAGTARSSGARLVLQRSGLRVLACNGFWPMSDWRQSELSMRISGVRQPLRPA